MARNAFRYAAEVQLHSNKWKRPTREGRPFDF